MTIEQAIAKIGEIGVIPVVRAESVENALRAVEAVCEGGISIVEITMTVPNAFEVIREVVRQRGRETLIGAGTVLSASQAERCIECGAEFLVSPGLSVSVLSVAKASGRLAIPGALTPTELMNAHEHGARLVKIFPAGNVGGPKYIKSLKGPFPDAALIPTGGVTVSNAGEFILAGAFAVGVGGDLVDTKAIREGNLEKITRAAADLLRSVRQAHESLPEKLARA
jgi:2-dehydro-3-deoxyphosphogluconate aldolase / (4S)-4-hydroxy-2-oxoglutarate aldolase